MVKNKIAQRAVAAGLTGLMAFGSAAPAALAFSDVPFEFVSTENSESGDYFKRIGGADRYATMKKIVEAYNKIGYTYGWNLYGEDRASVYNYHTTAIVASGDNFPDALAANGLAGYMTNMNLASGWTDGSVPVILTKAGSLSTEAKDLLKNMQVQNVIIMGGTAAVSQDVEDAIAKLGIGVSRVAGADRQETSVKALQRINGNWKGRKGTYDLIIATGDNYADALSIAPYAYRMGTPVVLTKADGTLTDQAVEAIKANDKIEEVVIVGGKEAVSDAVMGQIGTLRDNGKGVNYTRLAGADRYETSAKIAEFEVSAWREYWKGTDFSFDHVIVATGEKFPDALAGGQLAGGYWLPDRNIEDFSGLNAWKPCPLLLTKDGDRTAEGLISKQIAGNGITSNTSTYASQWSWNDTLRGAYGVDTDIYQNLIDVWYGCTTPKYVSYTALQDAATAASNTALMEVGEFTGYSATFGVDIEDVVTVSKITDVKVEGKNQDQRDVEFNVLKKKHTLDAWEPGEELTLEIQAETGSNKSVTVPAEKIVVTEDGQTTIEYVIENAEAGSPSKVTLTVETQTSKHVVRADAKDTTGSVDVKLVDFDTFELTYKSGDNTYTETATIGDGFTTLDEANETVTYAVDGFKLQGWYDDVIGLANSATPDFYGIVLGGKDAISQKKMDALDEAVAYTAGTDNVTTSGDLDIDVFSEDYGVNIRYTRLVPINTRVDYAKNASGTVTEYGLVYRVAATNDYVMWVYSATGDINDGRWVFVKGGASNTAYIALGKESVADGTIYGYNRQNPYNALGI